MVRRVVLTRPASQNTLLMQRLAASHVDAISAPALSIQPLRDCAELAAVPAPAGFDLVIFVSGNAVRHYLQLCMSRPDWQGWPAEVAGAAVGEATEKALREHPAFGPLPALYAPAAGTPAQDSEGLLACLQRAGVPRERVLIVRGQDGRRWLGDQLTAEGATVQACSVYRREPAQWSPEVWTRLEQWRQAQQKPAWLYTSPHGLAVVAARMQSQGLSAWWSGCPAIVTHPRLVQTWAEHAGVASEVGAAMVKVCLPTVEAVFEAIVSL